MTLSNNVVIGIDLGTTSSAVGVWRNGKVEIIPNDQGEIATNSCITFTDWGRLVGEVAMSSVWGFKSLLGRAFDDPAVQKGIPYWPFNVVNVDGKPNVEVKQNGVTKRLTPEELTCILIMYLKHKAEEYLCQGVNKAVITVPAGFNSFQVAATKKAAELAGLNVLKLISDPNAAALAYVAKTGPGGRVGKNLLIFNAAGGTTGVSVVIVEDGNLEVKATRGNTNLGGEHFVNKFLDSLSLIPSQLDSNDDDDDDTSDPDDSFSGQAASFTLFRMECETAKRNLSSATAASIERKTSNDRTIFRMTYKADFESVCADLFHEAVPELVSSLLADSKMEKSDIHEILLVGGSSRIPRIQELLQDYFNGKELNKSLDLDEAPVHGATLLAAIISGCGSPQVDLTLKIDVTPFSLGVETPFGIVSTLIPRNTMLPTKHTQTFTTAYDNQPAVIIGVYEIEREGVPAKDNNLLGTFILSEIPPAKAGVPRIDITFDVDANGTLTVIAVEKTTGNENRITMDPGNRTREQEQIRTQLVNEANAKKNQVYDAVRTSYEAVSKLYCSDQKTKDFLEKMMKELEEEEKRHELMLTRKGFPLVIVPINRNATNRNSCAEGGGLPSKKRRNQ